MVKAKLIIDGKEINVLWYAFSFSQGADRSGRPSQKPIFNRIRLIIETRKDLNLADWAFTSNQTKQIELHIYPIIMGGKTRKIYFFDAHLVNWKNNFSSTGSNPMTENLEVTSGGVEDTNSHAVYSTSWRITYPKEETKVTTFKQERRITHYYITDIEGNKIESYDIDDIILLNIETENRIGDIMTINLNDKEYDFEYNGVILKNDILKNIKIENNLEKIELKVVAPIV